MAEHDHDDDHTEHDHARARARAPRTSRDEAARQEAEQEFEREARRLVALARIRQYGDPVLRMKAREVEAYDDDLARLAERMTVLMHEAQGVGLAATQVGVLRRLFVFVQDDEDRVLVNPVITARSDETRGRRRGMPLAPGGPRAGRACVPGDDRGRRTSRARRVRLELELPAVEDRPARARPPRRRPHHRSHRRRVAARRARQAPAAARPRRAVTSPVAVAATAPFGADVLERLAARGGRPCLLTRPDAPAGRGRKVVPPPAKEAAERLGIPGAAARAAGDRAGARRSGRRRRRVRRDRAGRRARGEDRGSTSIRRSCRAGVARLPSSGRSWRAIRRRASRSSAREGARRWARSPRRRRSRSRPDDDAGAVYAKAAAIAAELLERVLDDRRAGAPAAACRRVDVRGEDRADDRELDLSRPAHELVDRVRALSPHIGARASIHGRPVTVWRARVADERRVRARSRSSPKGGAA